MNGLPVHIHTMLSQNIGDASSLALSWSFIHVVGVLVGLLAWAEDMIVDARPLVIVHIGRFQRAW